MRQWIFITVITLWSLSSICIISLLIIIENMFTKQKKHKRTEPEFKTDDESKSESEKSKFYNVSEAMLRKNKIAKFFKNTIKFDKCDQKKNYPVSEYIKLFMNKVDSDLFDTLIQKLDEGDKSYTILTKTKIFLEFMHTNKFENEKQTGHTCSLDVKKLNQDISPFNRIRTGYTIKNVEFLQWIADIYMYLFWINKFEWPVLCSEYFKIFNTKSKPTLNEFYDEVTDTQINTFMKELLQKMDSDTINLPTDLTDQQILVIKNYFLITTKASNKQVQFQRTILDYTARFDKYWPKSKRSKK